MTVQRPDVGWVGSPNYREQNGIRKEFAVLHWMVGNLAGTDASFVKSSFGVATNYGIENGVIHQYVADKDYAYGTGDTYANSRGISIEHAGGWLLPDGSRMKPTPATHESSARLLAWLSQTYGWGPLRVGVNVFGHNDFIATQCPGTTDLAWIAAQANQFLTGENAQQRSSTMPTYVPLVDFSLKPAGGKLIGESGKTITYPEGHATGSLVKSAFTGKVLIGIQADDVAKEIAKVAPDTAKVDQAAIDKSVAAAVTAALSGQKFPTVQEIGTEVIRQQKLAGN